MAKRSDSLSVNDRIDAAFKQLNKARIVAEQNAGGTTSDGWAVVNGIASERKPPPRGAVFYHGQDRDRGLAGAGLSLAYGAYEDDDARHDAASLAIAQEVVAVLTEHGVETVWDGTVERRIAIPPFTWKKKGDKLAGIDTRITAAGAGDLAKVQATPKHKLDERDQFGSTMLSTAAANDHAELVTWLLDAGATPDAHAVEALFLRYLLPEHDRAPRGTNHSLLHIAAWSGAEMVLRTLLARGFDLEARDPYGATPLISAAMRGTYGIPTLEALIAAGADVNAHDAVGRAALDHADDPAIVTRLLEAGARPDGGDRADRPERYKSSSSPVERFAFEGRWDVVELLLSRGAPTRNLLERAMPVLAAEGSWERFSRILAAGVTPEALERALVAAVTYDNLDLNALERLRAAGAKDLDGALAAALLWHEERREVVEWLVGLGARVGPTTLHAAVESGRESVIEQVLSLGADLQARDDRGCTPVMLAVQKRNVGIVKLLLERGADPQIRDRDGRLPLELAQKFTSSTGALYQEHRPILALLAKHGGDPDGVVPKPAAAAPAPPSLKVGDAIAHATFGRGRVLAMRGDKVDVQFEAAGKKVMLARLLGKSD